MVAAVGDIVVASIISGGRSGSWACLSAGGCQLRSLESGSQRSRRYRVRGPHKVTIPICMKWSAGGWARQHRLQREEALEWHPSTQQLYLRTRKRPIQGHCLYNSQVILTELKAHDVHAQVLLERTDELHQEVNLCREHH